MYIHVSTLHLGDKPKNSTYRVLVLAEVISDFQVFMAALFSQMKEQCRTALIKAILVLQLSWKARPQEKSVFYTAQAISRKTLDLCLISNYFKQQSSLPLLFLLLHQQHLGSALLAVDLWYCISPAFYFSFSLLYCAKQMF